MFRASFLRRLIGSAHRPESKPARRTRLAVEPLEDRAVPALITVNTLVDENNGIGDGSSVSLREAITQANALAGDDTIQIGVTGTIDLSGALPHLSSNITITGPGANLLNVHRNTTDHYSIFLINSGVTAAISDLTVSNGSATDFDDGLGIYSTEGGGIDNGGTLTLTNCTVSGNAASNAGGGILNFTSGTLTLIDCTVSDNSSSHGGGGIFNEGTLTVSQCTLSGNSASSGGGGIASDGTLTLNNSIVANSTSGGDVSNSGTLTGSHNLIEDDSGGLSDTITGDPKLGPLADNGGPTKTFALLPGSPAINAGDNVLAADSHGISLTTDQRGAGFARIVGAHVDIGAFEAPNSAPTLAAPASAIAFEDVDQKITGIKVDDPDGDALTVTLMVAHGTLALQTTGGQTVTGAVVTLSGSVADLNAALAMLSYRGALNFGGDDWLSVTVGDGSLSTTGSVAIHVQSAAQQADELQAQVDALTAAGVLNGGQANALDVKLLLQGNDGDTGRVQAFLNQVQAFLNAGILNQSQAEALLGPGNILLLSVTRR
jgi:predicted outer membrane repeat protein